MQKKLKEAQTREGMRALVVHLPAKLHRGLALARVQDRISMNEAIREAVSQWLSRRTARRRRQR
jgi:hypothetical protein